MRAPPLPSVTALRGAGVAPLASREAVCLTASQPVALAPGSWIQPHQPPGPGPKAFGPAPGGLGASEPDPLAVAELGHAWVPVPCPLCSPVSLRAAGLWELGSRRPILWPVESCQVNTWCWRFEGASFDGVKNLFRRGCFKHHDECIIYVKVLPWLPGESDFRIGCLYPVHSLPLPVFTPAVSAEPLHVCISFPKLVTTVPRIRSSKFKLQP